MLLQHVQNPNKITTCLLLKNLYKGRKVTFSVPKRHEILDYRDRLLIISGMKFSRVIIKFILHSNL